MKGMESSIVVAFRALVMLACLVVIPLAAIFGSAFPDVVKSTLIDRLEKVVAWNSGKSNSATPSRASTPDAGESRGSVEPASSAATAGSRWRSDPAAQAGSAGPTHSDIRTGESVPVGASVPIDSQSPGSIAGAAPGRSEQAGPPWPNHDSSANIQAADVAALNAQPNNVATSYTAPAGPVGPPNSAQDIRRAAPTATAGSADTGGNWPARQEPAGATRSAAASNPAAAAPDRFTAMERQLRQCGATYYLLETWGNDGEFYRFHCKMQIANNPNYTKHFEATDGNALAAMQQVLAQVQAWRDGRRQ